MSTEQGSRPACQQRAQSWVCTGRSEPPPGGGKGDCMQGGCPSPSAGDIGLSTQEGSTARPQGVDSREAPGMAAAFWVSAGKVPSRGSPRLGRRDRPPSKAWGQGLPWLVSTCLGSCSGSPKPQARFGEHGWPHRADGATWRPCACPNLDHHVVLEVLRDPLPPQASGTLCAHGRVPPGARGPLWTASRHPVVLGGHSPHLAGPGTLPGQSTESLRHGALSQPG